MHKFKLDLPNGNSDSLAIYYQNCRGLCSKSSTFYLNACELHYDIVLITETWLNDSFNSSEYFPPSYNVIRCDRKFTMVDRSTGGGVLIALADKMSYTVLDTSALTDIAPLVDVVVCECKYFSQTFLLSVVYIPPDIPTDVFETFLETFAITLLDRPVIVVGDFNVPAFRTQQTMLSSKVSNLQGFCDLLDLKQVNSVLNSDNRLLDLIFSTPSCNIEATREEEFFVLEDRYHPALSITLKITAESRSPVFASSCDECYNFRKADFIALYEDLRQVDWSFLDGFTDVNIALHEFYLVLYSVLDRSVPKSSRCKSSSFPPWFTKEIKDNIKMKRYFHKKWKSTGNLSYYAEFKRIRSINKTLITNVYTGYMTTIQNNIQSNPSELWIYLRSRQGTSRIPGVMRLDNIEMDNPVEIVNAFAKTFSKCYAQSDSIINPPAIPLDLPSFKLDLVPESTLISIMSSLSNKTTSGDDQIPSFLIRDTRYVLAAPLQKIINLAITTCTFPSKWKCARIVPVHKKDDKSEIQNYRPIAILCNFAKIFEQYLYNYICKNIEPYISSRQHGFVTGRSTVTNLACYTQYVSQVIDNQGQVDTIYTDFSRAFDTIDHGILLDKLHHFGFAPSLILLMASYLRDRTNFVFYNGFRSKEYISRSGVPQGSNLGPLLFIIFINDLLASIPCSTLGYADDIKIFSSVSNSNDCINLQRSIDYIVDWAANNKLILNINKCYVLSMTRKALPFAATYTIDGQVLRSVAQIKDLGVMFDSRLTFNCHLETVCAAASKTLGFIIRVSKCFDNIELLKKLYFSFVVSKLEYASIIWYPIYNNQIMAVERIQRRFLKYLVFKTSGEYPARNTEYQLLLDELSVLSLQDRRKIQSARFLYKLLQYEINCSELLASVNIHVPRLSSRTSPTFSYDTPKTNLWFRAPLTHMSINADNIYSDIFVGAKFN